MSLSNKNAEIEYNKDIISSSDLIEKIEEMGFEASAAKKESDFCRSALTVRGMKNDACVYKIETKLQTQPGVDCIKVSLEENLVRLIHKPDVISVNDICRAISELGFITEPISVDDHNNSFTKINVEGMTCMSCVNNIEDFVGKKAGVSKIKVSLKDKMASIWFDPNAITQEELQTIIDDMGFDATIQETTETDHLLKSSLFEIQTLGVTEWTTDDENSLFFSKGVISIKTTSNPKEVIVYYFKNSSDVNDIINIVQSMGFVCNEKSFDSLLKSSAEVSPVTSKSPKGCNDKGKSHVSSL